MRALVVIPKNDSELKFLVELLKRLDINSSALSYDNLEDFGIAKLLQGINKTEKASRREIMKKLLIC